MCNGDFLSGTQSFIAHDDQQLSFFNPSLDGNQLLISDAQLNGDRLDDPRRVIICVRLNHENRRLWPSHDQGILRHQQRLLSWTSRQVNAR